MGGESREQREHETARCGAGVELLGPAADANTMLLQLINCIQDQARFTSEPVEFIDEELIKLPSWASLRI